MNDTNCIFCKVLSGDLPSERIYEDTDVVALLDIVSPVNPGHTLVIPKTHVTDIFDVSAELWGKLASVVKHVAPAVRSGVGATDLNVAMNNGAHAGQKIFHLHIHLIPRFEGDGHEPWHGTPYQNGQAHDIAEKIKKAL